MNGLGADENQLPEQRSISSTMSLARASVTRVPAPIVAEEIAPDMKEFSTVPHSLEYIQLQANLQAPKPKKRNFFVALFQSRGKKKEVNVNNNSVSLSDVVSAIHGSSPSPKSVSVKKGGEREAGSPPQFWKQ